MIRQRRPHPEKVKGFMKDLVECFDAIENKWLKDDQAFIAGDKISIADIFAACELAQISKFTTTITFF